MTRHEAVKIAANKMLYPKTSSYDDEYAADNLIGALEALGVLKFDDESDIVDQARKTYCRQGGVIAYDCNNPLNTIREAQQVIEKLITRIDDQRKHIEVLKARSKCVESNKITSCYKF